MSVQMVLALLLLLLMGVVGGKSGITSFLSLFFNFAVLYILVLLLINGFPALFVTLLACVGVSYINLFYINGVNVKTRAAFYATLATTLFLLLLIIFVHRFAMIQGFGPEEVEEYTTLSFFVTVDFVQIGICTMLTGTIAAITDTAISISSSLCEVHHRNPHLNEMELFRSGMTIGKDIIGTTANTLYFSFIGGYLALFLWFRDLSYTFGEALNAKVLVSEVLSMFVIGIGVTVIIPFTAGVTAKMLLTVEKADE
ncbi:YibE/F family protein [Trichococcus ilyis]|uniref:YibE/F-like protein n=1 Tax=Trichococcus ilyis TaxID=640938 RepID=A0A143YL54_9LACT|nr:YibE/F family protein [Trichococcus ilyis]CZQ93229.1 Hypothetical protein TR210_1123 [Trichococcus ilyis]SEI91696.1 YibE/F-like protein [Trichococcus ilyis]